MTHYKATRVAHQGTSFLSSDTLFIKITMETIFLIDSIIHSQGYTHKYHQTTGIAMNSVPYSISIPT